MFSLKIRKYGSPHHTFRHGSNSMLTGPWGKAKILVPSISPPTV